MRIFAVVYFRAFRNFKAENLTVKQQVQNNKTCLQQKHSCKFNYCYDKSKLIGVQRTYKKGSSDSDKALTIELKSNSVSESNEES